jgi:hypothetical protein
MGKSATCEATRSGFSPIVNCLRQGDSLLKGHGSVFVLKAGVLASEVAKGFLQFFKDNGYEKNYLYGPCTVRG